MESKILKQELTCAEKELLQKVVNGGFCIGCGVCAALPNSQLSIGFNEYGMYQAKSKDSAIGFANKLDVRNVCPFSEIALNENELAKDIISKQCCHENSIGYYLSCYAGYVDEEKYRKLGSSGGFGTWIQTELLKRGMVDAIVNVHSLQISNTDKRLFSYRIATTESEVKSGAGSRYYPVEMSSILCDIRKSSKRYAIIGLPCFIKAIRLLSKCDTIFAERIKYCIGLVCGHLKSTRFAESLAWQMDILPNELCGFEFRCKLYEYPANYYGVKAYNRSRSVQRPVLELLGSDWGLGFFKYKACDYCDDVFAETADVVVGDAWLPQYVSQSEGANIVIVRKTEIQNIIAEAIKKRNLCFDKLEVKDIEKSQDAGLRHRREGLAYRLHNANHRGEWHPPKRVKPSASNIAIRTKRKYLLREKIRDMSHKSFYIARESGDLKIHISAMDELVYSYKQNQKKILRRIVSRAKRTVLSKMHLLRGNNS